MKKLLGFLICACVGMALSMGSTGCTKPKDKEKDPKKDTPVAKKDVTVTAEKAVTVKMGDSLDHELKVNRGAEATKEVVFVVEVEPKDGGVSATAERVAGDKSKGTLKITAKSDAKAAEHKVTVKSKSEGSADIPVLVVLVTVPKAKDVAKIMDMKLDAKTETKELKVKQGAKEMAKVMVAMGTDLKKATVKASVADEKGKEAKGVMAKVDADSMDKGGDATVTVSAAADAAPGDYVLTIETAGEGAVPPMVSTKIAVKVELKK